ncbi:RES domain-containing protein [Pseudoalteromonas sp. R3]|uniref:RES domain-containing protein n=1 Tax=Pseudoalteromonas sp. R3 TaxID=1709477 RepID=UPI0006B5ABB3|nr:RES domain-containing protein [Pseudoalteromonas sp. R3]AZZ98738.1 RES domain-containing protein [Pseudoalteromonas sp. R3]
MEQEFKLSYPRIELLAELELISKLEYEEKGPGELFYRIHNKDYGWDFYDKGLYGRFNGVVPVGAPPEFAHGGIKAFGTCYLSGTIEGALSESIFRNAHLTPDFFVPQKLLSSKRAVEVEVPQGTFIKFIDLTNAKTRRLLGIDTQVFSTADYDVCFAWAQMFNLMGFDGVKYTGRNYQATCYALFEKSRLDIDDGEDIGFISGDTVRPHLLELASELGVFVE